MCDLHRIVNMALNGKYLWRFPASIQWIDRPNPIGAVAVARHRMSSSDPHAGPRPSSSM